MGERVILSKLPDPRMVTVRRGGSLADTDHLLLALWAADCAEHVAHLFAAERPGDNRVRSTIDMARQWGRGEIGMREARKHAFAAQAAREVTGAAKLAALAASQAVVVSHVPSHNLGAAAYAIRAVGAANGDVEAIMRGECVWQRGRLPTSIRALVLDDQKLRNELCWSVFG